MIIGEYSPRRSRGIILIYNYFLVLFSEESVKRRKLLVCTQLMESMLNLVKLYC